MQEFKFPSLLRFQKKRTVLLFFLSNSGSTKQLDHSSPTLPPPLQTHPPHARPSLKLSWAGFRAHVGREIKDSCTSRKMIKKTKEKMDVT